MKALAVGVGLVLALVAGLPGPAAATDPRAVVLPGNPFAMTPPPARLGPKPAAPAHLRFPPHHHVRPPVIHQPGFISGYWTYQWMPTYYTTYVWMPGYITADGTWVGGYYQPQVVTGGYYQRVWVNGY